MDTKLTDEQKLTADEAITLTVEQQKGLIKKVMDIIEDHEDKETVSMFYDFYLEYENILRFHLTMGFQQGLDYVSECARGRWHVMEEMLQKRVGRIISPSGDKQRRREAQEIKIRLDEIRQFLTDINTRLGQEKREAVAISPMPQTNNRSVQ